MSENSTSQSITIEGVALAIMLLLLGAVVGILADRKKLKYQTKSEAKTTLLSSIYEFENAFHPIVTALRDNSLIDDQWEQLQHFADSINKAFSEVKAFGIQSNSLGEVQDLITRMNILGNKMLSSRKVLDYVVLSERKNYIQNLKTMADEGKEILTFANNLADKLQKEFDKKKYLIF